jgi:hypothetical protein
VPGRMAATQRLMPRLPLLAHPHPRLHPARHPALRARPALAVRRGPAPAQVTTGDSLIYIISSYYIYSSLASSTAACQEWVRLFSWSGEV